MNLIHFILYVILQIQKAPIFYVTTSEKQSIQKQYI